MAPNSEMTTRRITLLPIAVGAVLVASVVLRFWTQSDLWFDEALSVNIARLPLSEIPDALRHDGHPPLYYFLLHFWIDVFGIGDSAVRALSGVLAVVTLPLAWFAGRRLGGRPVAWTTVLVFATSPYAFRYATEARMYSLVMLLVTGGYLALRRALEVPSLGRLALVAAITGALTLTQYWNLYLIAAVGVGLLYLTRKAADAAGRRAPLRVLIAMVIGSLAFVPWLSSFLEQMAHTGTPWAEPQYPWVNLPNTLITFAGDAKDGEAALLGFFLLVLPLLGVFGRGLDRRRLELDLHTQPAVRWEAAAMLGALLLGTVFSYLTGTTFHPRYAATIFPLFVLVAAFGVTVFLSPRVRFVVVALVVVLGFAGAIRNVVTDRTQASEVADVIAAEHGAGDLVVYCPDQTGPSVSRLLRDITDLRQVTFPAFAAPQRVNWTDYLDRIDRADPREFAADVLRRADGATIWYVLSPGLLHQEKCGEIANILAESRPSVEKVTPDDSTYEFEGVTEFRPQ